MEVKLAKQFKSKCEGVKSPQIYLLGTKESLKVFGQRSDMLRNVLGRESGG